MGTWLQLGLETAVALALGLVVGSAAPVRAVLLAGAAPAARLALRIGITLLGARLTLGQLIDTGGASVVAIVVVVAVGLLLGTMLARRFGVRSPLSALITVGMAICGNSAILALAPIVRAPHRETAYAVSTITIFGLVGVLLLPVLGAALGLSDAVFGTWAGLAVNDTAQVVATGYAYSPAAGDVATVVKLTRNLAILPVLLGATWLTVRAARDAATDRDRGDQEVGDGSVASDGVAPRVEGVSAGTSIGLVARAVPWFVIGFVVFAGLRTAGLLDGTLPTGGTVADLCSVAAAVLILVALAGVGISTDVRAMIGVGAGPFLLGAVMWIVLGLLALALSAVVAGSAGVAGGGLGGAGTASAPVYHGG